MRQIMVGWARIGKGNGVEINQLIEFIKEVDKLKNVDRKCLTHSGSRYENSAEHSWHLVLSVLIFSNHANEAVDILKCVKMAVIHDLVEIDAGDQIVYAEDANKFERELAAAKKIFAMLPKNLEEEFLELWVAFEKNECAEAKFVNSLDRFLPVYSNVLNQGFSWNKHGISAEQVYGLNKREISKGSTELWEKTNHYLKDCEKNGYLN